MQSFLGKSVYAKYRLNQKPKGEKKAVTGLVLGAFVGILALLGIAAIISALGSYSSGH